MSSRLRVVLWSTIPTGAALLYLLWTFAWKKNKPREKVEVAKKPLPSVEVAIVSENASEIVKSEETAVADTGDSDNSTAGPSPSRHLSGSDAGNFSLSDELDMSSSSCGQSLGAGEMSERQRSSTELDCESDDTTMTRQCEPKDFSADVDTVVFTSSCQSPSYVECNTCEAPVLANATEGPQTTADDINESSIMTFVNQQTWTDVKEHTAETDGVEIREEEITVENAIGLESTAFGHTCEVPGISAGDWNNEIVDHSWGSTEAPSVSPLGSPDAWSKTEAEYAMAVSSELTDATSQCNDPNSVPGRDDVPNSIDGNGNEYSRQIKKVKNVDDRQSLSKDNSLKTHSFDFPTEFCGQLIGKRGHNIKLIKEKSGVEICIQPKIYNMAWQVVTLEGTRQQVNKALDLIRRKFPSKYYPGIDFNHCMPDMPLVPADVMQLMLPTGVPLEVVVCHVYTPNHVFVQQPTHPTFPSLERQTINMNACYQVEDVPGLPRPVSAGIICAAPVGSNWYRAQVVQSNPEADDCIVKLVDYGGYVNLPCSSLRQIRADFMSLPFQAIECYLSNVIPPKDDDDFVPEAKTSLEELVNGSILQCTVTAFEADGVPYVELVKITDKGNQAIIVNRELVRREFARWLEM